MVHRADKSEQREEKNSRELPNGIKQRFSIKRGEAFTKTLQALLRGPWEDPFKDR